MTTVPIGYTGDSGFNDFVHDGSMTQAWLGTFGIGGTTTVGRMVQVDSYAAANSAGGTGGAVAWVATNPASYGGSNLYTTSDSMAIGSGTTAVWHTKTGDIPTISADVWEFGFACTNGVWVVYIDGGGTTQVKANAIANTTGGTNVNTYQGRGGSLGGYGTFFVVETYVRRTGSMHRAQINLKRTGQTQPKIAVRRSGSWTQVGHLAANIAFDPDHLQHEIIFKDENGIWQDGLLCFEGPYYLGPQALIDFHHRGHLSESQVYELVA